MPQNKSFVRAFEKTAAIRMPTSLRAAHLALGKKTKGFSRQGVRRLLARRGVK